MHVRHALRALGALTAAAAALCGAVGAPAAADSLFVAGKSRSMFTDRKARSVGDIVTIQITEQTVAVQDATSEVQRKGDAQAGGGAGLFGLLTGVPKAALSGGQSHAGTGTTARSSKLVTLIPARVVEVTPAGQLVLQGERLLKINSDTQTLRFTGIVRPEDIEPNNTVASGVVADAKIEVLGKGPIDRSARPGFLGRIFQFLF